MITLIGGQKGGTGKSTVAVNIAIARAKAGKKIILVDGNAVQGSASNWASRRKDSDFVQFDCIKVQGNIFERIKELNSQYDEVIVDTGGQDSVELRTAMLAAHILITPVAPSQVDVETLLFVNNLVSTASEKNTNLRAKILINCAPTHPKSTKAQEAKDLLKSLSSFTVLDSHLARRTPIGDAFEIGAGALDLKGKAIEKAQIEISSVVKEIYNGK